MTENKQKDIFLINTALNDYLVVSQNSKESVLHQIMLMLTSSKGYNPLYPDMGCLELLNSMPFTEGEEYKEICNKIQYSIEMYIDNNIEVEFVKINRKEYIIKFFISGIEFYNKKMNINNKNNLKIIDIKEKNNGNK